MNLFTMFFLGLLTLSLGACKMESSSSDSDDELVNDPDPVDSVTEIIMFAGPGMTSGNLGGRTGADTLCRNAIPSGLTCSNQVRAFLSVDATDELRDMEANYDLDPALPIKATNGSLVSDNFATIIGGAASVFEDGPSGNNTDTSIGANVGTIDLYFPTGSNQDGSVSAGLTCSGWTSNSGGDFFDDVDHFNLGMFPEGGGDCSTGSDSGNQQETLLCLCW
jgi:hypothetical protein